MSLASPFSDSEPPLSIAYAYRVRKQSRIIYITVLAAFIVVLIALPYINIPVSVKATGVLLPESRRYELISPVQGRILKVFVAENQKVRKGDTVLIMDASVTAEQITSLNERALQLEQFIEDLEILLRYSKRQRFDDPLSALQTGRYNAALKQFLEEVQQKKNTRGQKERMLNRYGYLYKNGVITRAEFEGFKFEHDQSVSGFLFLVRQYRFQWQTDMTGYREELRQIKTRIFGLQQERDLYSIISPYDGSIQNLKLLQKGTYALASQKIAEISPDGKLKAYCFVRPADIGEIKRGQRVSFQVEAFNYAKWGSLTGRVAEISDDVVLLNDEVPVFRIECFLDRDYFEAAGSRAYLKKGMSFTARFRIGDYSLLQLLYRSADDMVGKSTDIGN